MTIMFTIFSEIERINCEAKITLLAKAMLQNALKRMEREEENPCERTDRATSRKRVTCRIHVAC